MWGKNNKSEFSSKIRFFVTLALTSDVIKFTLAILFHSFIDDTEFEPLIHQQRAKRRKNSQYHNVTLATRHLSGCIV